MGLSSFFKRAPAAEAGRRQPLPQDPAAFETLRTRARRRLIGVAVLVVGAVAGLPRLFDAPPRPADQAVAVRVAGQEPRTVTRTAQPEPIVSPGGAAAVAPSQGLPAVAMPSRPVVRDDHIITEPKPDPQAEARAVERQREQERKAQAERERAEREKAEKLRLERERQKEREKERERERERAAKAEKARQEQLKAEKAREAEKAEKAEKAREAEKQRVRREAERRDKDKAEKAEKADKVDKGRRYVVQVGSYSESRAVRETRQRVDRLGLDSFEQHVETSSGARTRVRLGPFATKDEAVRAAAKLKAAGMNAAVLPL